MDKRIPIVWLIASEHAATEDISTFLSSNFDVRFVDLNASAEVSFSPDTAPGIAFIIASALCIETLIALIKTIRSKVPWMPILVRCCGQTCSCFAELKEKYSHLDIECSASTHESTASRLRRLLGVEAVRESAVQDTRCKVGIEKLIGRSESIMNLKERIPRIAESDCSVLITGDSGTGKEVVARAIHYTSDRVDRPFVKVNCAAIANGVVESELFGHTAGAFTGATKDREGFVSQAEGGTLFLDEIHTLTAENQSKLLRFLAELEYYPVGSSRVRNANVRILAATNINVEEAIAKGVLHLDFCMRLNVVRISLPSLRERKSDIDLLAKHFIRQHAVRYRKPVMEISPAALMAMFQYEWPGNVREMENVIRHALVETQTATIQVQDLDLPCAAPVGTKSLRQMALEVVRAFVKAQIKELLIVHAGNITHAARSAVMNKRSFRRLVRKYKIDVQALSRTGGAVE